MEGAFLPSGHGVITHEYAPFQPEPFVQGVRYGLGVGGIPLPDLVGDGQTVPVDQKSDLNLAAVRTMVPAVAVFGQRTSLTSEVDRGGVVKDQGEVQCEKVGHFPEDGFLQGFLVPHQVVQTTVFWTGLPLTRVD